MPYKNTDDLPHAVKSHLPLHAQEIYIAAFNSAWKEYKEPQKRLGNASQEETAHKVAWAAVKKNYMKERDFWEKI